jgi:hypothetical protein
LLLEGIEAEAAAGTALDALTFDLVTLVRFGWLVSVGDRRPTPQDVNSDLRRLLLTILEAKDIEAAYARLAGEESSASPEVDG